MKKPDKATLIIFIIVDIIMVLGSIVSSIAIYNIISLSITCFNINYYKISNGAKKLFKILGAISIFTFIVKLLNLAHIKGPVLFYLLVISTIITYYLIIELPLKVFKKK